MRLQAHPNEQQLEPESQEGAFGQAEHFADLLVPQQV